LGYRHLDRDRRAAVEEGHGLTDGITGGCVFSNPVDKNRLS
jgi:hypothetical protein